MKSEIEKLIEKLQEIKKDCNDINEIEILIELEEETDEAIFYNTVLNIQYKI